MGEYVKNKKHGQGTFIYPDGSKYEGEMKVLLVEYFNVSLYVRALILLIYFSFLIDKKANQTKII